MTQYMLSVFHEPGVHAAGTAYEDEAAMQAAFAEVAAFNERLESAGSLVFACGLTPPEAARVVTGDGMSEGPMAQAPLMLGGFWVVEAADDAAAAEVARDASQACGRPVEVRALQG